MQLPPKTRSSVIRDFDYDGNRKTLYVTFVSGKIYVYNLVPQRTFDEFTSAESKGEFFSQHIKDQFPYALAASSPSGVRH